MKGSAEGKAVGENKARIKRVTEEVECDKNVENNSIEEKE